MNCSDTDRFLQKIANYYRMTSGMVIHDFMPSKGTGSQTSLADQHNIWHDWLDMGSLNSSWLMEWSSHSFFEEFDPEYIKGVLYHTADCPHCSAKMNRWKKRIQHLKRKRSVINTNIMTSKVFFANGINGFIQLANSRKQPIADTNAPPGQKTEIFRNNVSSVLPNTNLQMQRNETKTNINTIDENKNGKNHLFSKWFMPVLPANNKKFLSVLAKARIILPIWMIVFSLYSMSESFVLQTGDTSLLQSKLESFGQDSINSIVGKKQIQKQKFKRTKSIHKNNASNIGHTDQNNNQNRNIHHGTKKTPANFLAKVFHFPAGNHKGEWDYLVNVTSSDKDADSNGPETSSGKGTKANLFQLQNNVYLSADDAEYGSLLPVKAKNPDGTYAVTTGAQPQPTGEVYSSDKQNFLVQELDQQWPSPIQQKIHYRYKYLRHLVHLFPHDKSLRIDLAIYAHFLGKKEERYQQLVFVLTMDSNKTYVDQDQAMKLFWQGVEKKLSMLEKSVRNDPHNEPAIQELVMLYKGLGFYALADHYIRKWISLS